MPVPNFKPALTPAQLKEIQDRNKGNADVKALLWEIKRLHCIVSRADQLAQSLGPASNGGYGLVVGLLRQEIEDEPFLVERKAHEDAILKGQKK